MSRKGAATWTTERNAITRQCGMSGRRASRLIAIGTSTSDASTSRTQTTTGGATSSIETLMNMYDAPHSAARRPIIVQERRVIEAHADVPGLSAPVRLLTGTHQRCLSLQAARALRQAAREQR